MMKELFMNAAKCAYLSVLQADLLNTSGMISIDFLDTYFFDKDNSILDTAFDSIRRCLNLKKCAKFYKTNSFSDYDYEDVCGRIYNAGDIYKIFAVKHTEKWYEDVWDCIREGKDGAYKLIEEALQDVRAYDEQMNKRRDLLSEQ